MVGRDEELVPHIEPMCRSAVGGDARVEVKPLAVKARGLLDQPVHESLATSTSTRRRKGRDIVDVEVVAPGQGVNLTKPGHGHCIGLVSIENSDEAVPRWPQGVVDEIDKGRSRLPPWPQLQHRQGSPLGFVLRYLANVDHARELIGTLRWCANTCNPSVSRPSVKGASRPTPKG